MPTSRTTFTKRQKERARQEKQADKAQKKAERKLQRLNPDGSVQEDDGIDWDYVPEAQLHNDQ